MLSDWTNDAEARNDYRDYKRKEVRRRNAGSTVCPYRSAPAQTDCSAAQVRIVSWNARQGLCASYACPGGSGSMCLQQSALSSALAAVLAGADAARCPRRTHACLPTACSTAVAATAAAAALPCSGQGDCHLPVARGGALNGAAAAGALSGALRLRRDERAAPGAPACSATLGRCHLKRSAVTVYQ
jgi:hypothetical protein